jgi:hypothetical protein
MSNDAFPNAEQLFRDAFALPDPAPELLRLIKAHPTYAAVMDLLVHYTAVVQGNPSRANALALALVAVRDSPDAPVTDADALDELFSRQLADLHSRGFDFLDNPRNHNMGIVPTNTFLLTSLLSGLSIKYDLTDSSDQYGTLWEGLDADDSNSSISEVRVIGACIQLLTSGSIIIRKSEEYIQSADEALTKLKAQKARGTMKDSNALQLLEVCQSLMKYKIQTQPLS